MWGPPDFLLQTQAGNVGFRPSVEDEKPDSLTPAHCVTPEQLHIRSLIGSRTTVSFFSMIHQLLNATISSPYHLGTLNPKFY